MTVERDPTTDRMTDPSGLPRPTARLLLRRLSTDDLEPFVAVRADTGLGRYQGWLPMTHEAALAFLEEMQAAPAWLPGVWFQLGIAERAGGRLVGDFGVCVHDGGHAEIGVTLAAEVHGRGYATEALGGLIGLLFGRPQIHRVVGIVDARNRPSARLLERAGLRHVQTLQTTFRGEACVEQVFAREREPVVLRRATLADATDLARFAARSFVDTYGAQNRPQDTAAHVELAYGPVQQAAELADPAITTLLM